jgi:outer membrane protein assembly factor BamB
MKARIACCSFGLLAACSWFDPEVGPALMCMDSGGADLDGSVYGGSSIASCLPLTDGVAGNVLVADQFNNRVIELTRAGTIVWSFGDGKNVPGPTSVVAPNDVERLPSGRTLISGTGSPPGMDPNCASDTKGCPDNRVIIVDDKSGAIVWQYGADQGRSGSGPGELNTPVAAVFVPQGGDATILITDQGNNRIVEVSERTKGLVQQFPPAGSKETLTSPNSAERLVNGHTLIADEGGNRVVEIDSSGTVTWQYPTEIDLSLLNGPAFASRLPDGHTLITDSNNGRVIEVDSSVPPSVVWTYSTANRDPSVPSPHPTRAVRLANGHTLIADQFNEQVIEVVGVARTYIVYSYGKLGIPGRAAGELSAPYDAKIVGDYTGLTSPM